MSSPNIPDRAPTTTESTVGSDTDQMKLLSRASIQAATGEPRGGVHRLQQALVVAAVAVAAAVVGVAPANAEQFHSSNMLKNFRPWGSSTNSYAPPSTYTLPSGRAVNMKCWTTGSYVDGTAKWFSIQDTQYPFETGYVPANDVGNQWTTSPQC